MKMKEKQEKLSRSQVLSSKGQRVKRGQVRSLNFATQMLLAKGQDIVQTLFRFYRKICLFQQSSSILLYNTLIVITFSVINQLMFKIPAKWKHIQLLRLDQYKIAYSYRFLI